MNTITFVTKNNNSFYKLEIAKTLLHFIEYDFTYFWEQCIDLGIKSRKQGGYSSKQLGIIKNMIIKCHPYYEAKINSDFEHIVLDCIIEYICHSENIGLEELWTRCISPKNLYEKAIFSRISEYKTNRAINQWSNIMRTQEYARKKLEFVFSGEPASKSIYMARKGYFDLTFSVAAKEIGFPSSELPSARYYNAELMPNSAFMLSKVSKTILKKIGDIVDDAQQVRYSNVSECMCDQLGLDAFGYIKNLPRPSDLEIKTASETLQNYSDGIYMTESFKAIIDLEFDKMLEENIFFQQCEMCGKYFQTENNYVGRFCNRVNATGKTCREQHRFEIPPEQDTVTQDFDSRCDRIYNELLKKVGREIEEKEFREWAQYLINMKENVQKQYSTTEDLEAFLEYSEKMAQDIKMKPSSPIINNRPPTIPEVKQIRPEPVKYHFPTIEELDNR